MSNILRYSCTDGRQELTFAYENKRNIDDITMRVHNDLSSILFLHSSVNQAGLRIDFDTEKKIPSLNKAVFSEPEDLYMILLDMRSALELMRKYRIDRRYLVHETAGIFKDLESGFNSFALVPCIEIFDRQKRFGEMISALVQEAGFSHLIDAEAMSALESAAGKPLDDEDLLSGLLGIMREMYPGCGSLTERHVSEKIITLASIPDSVEPAVPAVPAVPAAPAAPAVPAETEVPAEHENVPQEEVPAAEEEAAAEQPAVAEPQQESSEPELMLSNETWLSNLKDALREEILAETQKKHNAYLVIRRKGEISPLSGDTFIIGKASAYCDYVINDNPAISRMHAIIRYNEAEDQYYIIDCESTNHTYLNGKQIPSEEAVPLEDQMIIHLASEALIFKR